MNKRHLHYVNGRWVEGSGPSITAKNPATGEVIWEGNSANDTLIEQAIEAAKNAFSEWSQLEFDQRASLLEKFHMCLLEKQESLAETISISTGKPLWEAKGEVLSMANKVTISIDSFKTRCPTIKTPQAQNLSITRHRAHGVMAVLGPFNFPGHLPNGHIVPALLAGNTVIFKPSELAPLVAEHTAQCWESVGLPAGVFNMLQGGKETGQLLSEHPKIDGLLFTGSWQTGKHLSEFMAKTPYKILALEMGGNNPLVVGTLSDFNAAAYLTIQSAYLTAGQHVPVDLSYLKEMLETNSWKH
jgi:succinylglutamic semialdehyde dehydrogenase